jgi:serine/threonine-protein kinase
MNGLWPSVPPDLSNGRFTLHDVLGVGGVGTVYRGRDKLHQQDVAIKVLHASALGTVLERRFVREGTAMQRLRHPNVVRVHAVGREEPFPWIVMELVDGGTAHGWLRKRGPMPIREVIRVVRALADALAEVHRHGWVHRDVKPGNVLLGTTGDVKLGDFGIVREDASDITGPGVALGTSAFMSPEQMDDPAAVTTRSDLYSLGATAFALATALPPRALDRDGLSVAPERLRPLLARACAADPSERYDDAAQMSEAFRELGDRLG